VKAPSEDEFSSPMQAEKSKHSRQDVYSDPALEAYEGHAGTSELSKTQKKNLRLYNYVKIGTWQSVALYRLEPLDKDECTVEELSTTNSRETNKYFSPETVSKALQIFRAGRKIGGKAHGPMGPPCIRKTTIHSGANMIPGSQTRICNIIFNSEALHLVPQVNTGPDVLWLKLHEHTVSALN
jgi:hypothetical protein